jgi:hypothetical protein
MTSVLDQIKSAKKNNTFLHIKNFNSDVPSWDNFINNLNYKYNNNYDNKEKKSSQFLINENVKTEILSQHNLMDTFSHYSYVFKDGKNIFKSGYFDGCNDVAEILNNSLMEGNSSIHVTAITNFIKHDKKYEIHSDQTEVINWHCIGKIDWNVYDKDSKCSTLSIEPGDLVFIPAGMKHEVIVYEPRASLIFDFILDLDASI